jgi:hypothetical protein
VVASAIIGLAGSVLQIPVALYLLCKSKRMTTSAMILDISMGADMVRMHLMLLKLRIYIWMPIS